MRPPAHVPRIRDYLQLLRDGWIVILCATALSVGAGWVAWKTVNPVYYSTARVFATTPGSATPLDAYYGHLSSVSRTVTIQQLARSPQVTLRTINELGLQESPADPLASHISVVVKDSALMEIVVSGDDPDLTRRTADAVAENLIEVTREIRAVDTSSPELVLVDAAEPARPRGSMWDFLLPAGGFGLALSVVLVLGYGLVRDRLLGKGQIDHVVDEAVAGEE